MKQRLYSGADTGVKDKDGKPITVHCYIADAAGDIYNVNSYCQAVPKGDGAATDLDELVSRAEVRVLSADEVLAMQAPSDPANEKRTRRRRAATETAPRRKGRIDYMNEGGVPKPEASGEVPAVDPEKEAAAEQSMPKDAIPVDLAIILKTVPDRILAEELRRRGYAFTAVKPIILTV